MPAATPLDEMPQPVLKICHRIPGASKATDIPERKLWDAVKDGDLRSFKLGRTRLITDEDLRA
jgi:hypothetical protein